MALNNFISETVFLPLGDFVTGQSISRQLHFLKKSQYWTREQIDNYQNEKLRQLVHHAFNNVPYYRDLFSKLRLKPDDIRTKKDLEKLPITTKEELKKNKDKHLSSNLKKKDLIFSSSSGSTGEPFQFYKTKHSESFMKAAAIRAWSWMGYRLGDKYVKVSMNPRSSLLKRLQDKMNNCLYLSSTQLTPVEFQKIANAIIKFDPCIVRCYPVPLQLLAQQIFETTGKYRGEALKAINTTGSTLQDDVRKKIENVFGVKIFDSYSCEGGTVFSECPSHTNYHPAEEYAISEFIADNYTNSDEGKPLRHISTDLHNYASPFIRYDTQDYLVLNEQENCSCGRHFLNIKKIKGRDSDILKTPSGKYLIVENFVAYFEWITEVDQIQVVQEDFNKIIIKMMVNNSFNNEVLQKIQKYWNEYIGDNVNVLVEIVDEIKLTPTGKRRTLIRNPKIFIND
jgi:phenylacetate-CoA ligase